MAETFQFDLVSPERSLASLQAHSVQIPGAEGDMTVMADHAPVITTLRPGVLRVEGPGGTAEFVVTSGFAEIRAASASVLAEKAVPVGEMTRARLDEMVAEARARYEAATKAADADRNIVDDAAKLLADMEAIGTHINV
jgi:F-type H+-transporting ATPase subunit epsilon